MGRALAIPLAAHLQKDSFFPKVCQLTPILHTNDMYIMYTNHCGAPISFQFCSFHTLYVGILFAYLQDSVSIVSLGEGSTNNAHFLAVSMTCYDIFTIGITWRYRTEIDKRILSLQDCESLLLWLASALSTSHPLHDMVMMHGMMQALNLAEYSVHMKRKCPLVLMVSDNQMCISLKDDRWIRQVKSCYWSPEQRHAPLTVWR